MSDSFEDQDSAPAKADTVRVAVRVRPLNEREKSISTNARFSWKVDSSSVAQCDNGKVLQQNIYTFDNVFQQDSTNSQIFDTIAAPVVKSTVDGMNGVIFAYGQTAAGKTYTMLGTEHDPGVTRRAITRVFDHVQEQTNRQFLLRASYIEIYNEVIRDLLVSGNENLKIHEDVFNKRVFVDAKEEVVMSVDQVMDIIAAGENAREVGETNMNERSSRSHTIFSLKIESREMEPDPEQSDETLQNNGVALRSSTLSLVDLAGSERASFTKAQGQRLVEGGYINKSLLTLGTVINKLSSGVTLSSGHIPYRDSKLTRLLQPALGGNARTSIICAVTPAVLHMDETISTLKFASRAKKVTNMAKANEYLDDRAKLRKAEKKIASLRAELEILRANTSAKSSMSSQVSNIRLPASRISEGERVQAFQEMWNKILGKIPSQEVKLVRWSDGNAFPPRKEYKRPSLTSALDLCTGRVSTSSDGIRDESVADELAELRKKVMRAEKAKRQAFSEIEYERQAMCDEVQLLVAGSEEATMARIAAEQDADRALSMLGKEQARSLVDELVTHAMTKSEISKGLRTAERKLVTMDKIRKEHQTFKETLAGLRKEHAEVMRREKRGLGPVLKEAKLAQDRASDLENRLRNARQSGQKLISEKASIERELKDRNRKIKVLSSEVERNRKHNEKVQHRIRDAVAEERKRFDSVLDKVKEELSSEQGKVEKLENELKNAQQRLESLQRQEKKTSSELSYMTLEIEKLREELLQRDSECRQILTVSEERSSELEDAHCRLKEIEKDRDSLELYRTKLEEENVRKGDDLARKIEELGRVYLELEETRSELECVKQDREDIKNHVKSLKVSVREAENCHNTALRSIKELQDKIGEKEYSLQRAREEKTALEARLEKLTGVQATLTETQESVNKLSLQLSERQASDEASQRRIMDLEKEVGQCIHDMKSIEDQLETSRSKKSRLECEVQTANTRHDQLLRIVEELERINGELIKKDCETCVLLRKQVAAIETTKMNGVVGKNEKLIMARDENDKLRLSVEQLTAETATRMREMLRLMDTIRNRDDQLRKVERTLDSMKRGEGIVAKLEERVKRRDMHIGALNRELEAQCEVLKNEGLSEQFADIQRRCAIESENDSLRSRNGDLEERIQVMEREREEIREETLKLRDKIKEKDCRRIERAIARKEGRLEELRGENERTGEEKVTR